VKEKGGKKKSKKARGAQCSKSTYVRGRLGPCEERKTQTEKRSEKLQKFERGSRAKANTNKINGKSRRKRKKGKKKKSDEKKDRWYGPFAVRNIK